MTERDINPRITLGYMVIVGGIAVMLVASLLTLLPVLAVLFWVFIVLGLIDFTAGLYLFLSGRAGKTI